MPRPDLFSRLRDHLGRDVGERLRVVDPLLGGSAEVVIDPGEPGGSNETTRLTFHVPHDNTMVSLGKPSSDWRADEGITARTDNHIVFEIAEDVKTFVSLGKPSPFGKLMGLHGFGPPVSSGYSMVTEGWGWSESKESNVVLSRDKDAIVASHGPRALLMATDGLTEMHAAKGINVATPASVAIVAHEGITPPVLTYKETVADSIPEEIGDLWAGVSGFYSKYTDAAVNAVAAVLPGLTLVGTKKGSPDWLVGERSIDGVMIGAFNFLVGLGAGKWLGTGSNFGATAQESADVYGGRSASLFGGVAAGVGSMGFSSMFGTTAGVTGILGLGLVGVNAAELASGRDAAVRSFGSATVAGRKSVQVESSTGWVAVGSKVQTQVTSSGKTAVYGADYASITAGHGEGHGATFEPGSAFVGHVTKTNALGGAKPDDKRGLSIEKSTLKAKMGKSELVLKKNGQVEIQATSAVAFKVSRTSLEVTSAKILLG